jgi:Putative auto-transporter adhesin, head GIN domain
MILLLWFILSCLQGSGYTDTHVHVVCAEGNKDDHCIMKKYSKPIIKTKKMKQKIMVVSLLVLSVCFASCSKEKIKDTGIIKEQEFTYPVPFGSIDNNGRFDVKIIPSTFQKVKIKADEAVLNEIVAEVGGNHLSLHYKNPRKDYKHSQVLITVYTTPLSEIALAGSGTVSSDQTLTGGLNLYTNLSGSGSMDLKVDYPSVKTNVSGSGSINLQGAATSAIHTVSGSGKIKSYGFTALEAEANVSGSGSIQVSATNSLKGTVSGSGSIYYKGNPVVNINRSGSGRIVHE